MGAPLKVLSTLDRDVDLLKLTLFAMAFSLGGWAMGYYLYLRPLWESQAARTWMKVPCKILKNDVKPFGRHGSTFGLDVAYIYELSGKVYVGDRFDFTPYPTDDYGWLETARDRHVPDRADFCYVNPQNLGQAVLERDFVRNDGYLWGGSIFFITGVAFMVRLLSGLIRRQKFGQSYFEIRHAPVPLGGILEGTVWFGRKMFSSGRCKIRLVNYSSRVSGRTVSAYSGVLWHGTQFATSHDGVTLPVKFTLPRSGIEGPSSPAGLLSLDISIPIETRGGSHFWRVEVTAEVPGVDYAAYFEIPVVAEHVTDWPSR